MFLECIDYINKVKTGPFAEHSNQLWGISGVSHWTKVNQGLIKMYKVEVSIFYANFEFDFFCLLQYFINFYCIYHFFKHFIFSFKKISFKEIFNFLHSTGYCVLKIS